MREILSPTPSLVSLCVEAIKRQLVLGTLHQSPSSSDDGRILITPDVYDLPPDLFELLVSRLPPLALEKLQAEMPFKDWEGYDPGGCSAGGRKRGRKGDFSAAWKSLFELRWPGLACRMEPVDWQQIYWQTHFQNCLDEAAESALIPSFSGALGKMEISEGILKCIGCDGNMKCPTITKLSFHCRYFASYARHLRLQTVLFVEEISQLLEKCRLQSLVLRWIRSREHVDGLCKLLIQNSRTLTSLEFIHCKLSASFINAIFGSLQLEDLQGHGVEQLSINSSSFLEMDPYALPHGLVSFLSSGRSLCKIKLHDNHIDQDFAQLLFTTIIDASSNLSILDLSDNNIAGCLTNINWRSSNLQSSLGTANFLRSLRVLNLRGNNLCKVDMDSLRHALSHMHNLEVLDISDNAIRDDGIRSLMHSFLGASIKCSPLAELRLENCELSCDGVAQLLHALSTWKEPLKSLSLADNYLGRHAAGSLGEFLSSSIEVLNIGGIDLGSDGFQALEQITIAAPKLVEINISKNRGGLGTANFLSKLIPLAPKLVAIDAAYNLMPVESLDLICAALKVQKGTLERLDLTGNTWELQPSQHSMLDNFRRNGHPILILPSSNAPDIPYDDDP